jgi:serine/threonine protein kinase
MSGFVARIIDFGMARSLIIDAPREDGGEMLMHHIRVYEEQGEEASFPTRTVSVEQRSTTQYSAPEAWLSKGHYDSKVDVWAVGCLLSELLYCCDSSQLVRNSSSRNRLTLRFLFPPEQHRNSLNPSSLPSILKHVVAPSDDLMDAASGAGAKVLSDRFWNSLVARGFIDPGHPEAVNRPFMWFDLASKFPTPELPPDEVPVFDKLRALMLRMLAFDPDQRFSAAEALCFLTGASEPTVRVADNLLQEFRTLQEMLDESTLPSASRREGLDRERCLQFIRHVDPDHPCEPSPLSLLLH